MDFLIKKWTIQLEYGLFQFDIVLTVTNHKPFLFSLYQKAQVLYCADISRIYKVDVIWKSDGIVMQQDAAAYCRQWGELLKKEIVY